MAQSAGLIALVLEKRETAPNRTYFTFDPFEFYVQNEQVTKTLETAAGVVSIDRVLITNDRDDELDVFEPGQSLLIHAHFTCKGRVKNPIFIIAFHDTAGNVVFGLNTRNVSYHLGMLDAGEHKMLVRFGLLNLLQGKYTVSVGAWEYDSPDPHPAVSLRHALPPLHPRRPRKTPGPLRYRLHAVQCRD
ncbi:MAG: Wzt carbohydrate-binding domain-containing protein [Deltaproteobacteria bacterium]|nr:Wzt carbohydrate-binding domain-containing protein [Deltaproteobacteria bacterium]